MCMVPPASTGRKGGDRPWIEYFFDEIEDEVIITLPTNPLSQTPAVGPPREMRRQESTFEVRIPILFP